MKPPPPAGPRAALLLVALPALGCVSTVSAERAPAWRQQQALATLEDQEADGRVRLERWCGSALEAQAGRCAALQRLLVQTGLARTPPLQQLEADASALADSAERQRIAARLARSAAKQQLATAKLDAEDAAKDVDVFQRAEEQLGKANEYAKLLEPLISGARAEEHKRQAKLLLVQTQQEEDAGAIEASRLEEEYGEKRKAISQNLQQRFTVERSMEVLTAALEDESAYLAELQTTCDLGKKVYQRLKEGPLVVLNVSLASIAERLQQSRQHVGAHDVVAVSAAPVAGNAQDEPVQEGGDHAPLTLAKALQALPANAPVAAEPQSQRPRPKTTVAAKAWPTSDGASSATVVEVKATSKTASATPMKHQAHKSVASRVASHARSSTDAPKAAAHSPKAPSHETAAPQQPRPAAAHAPHVAARAPARRLRKQVHAAALTTPRPQADHPAEEPVAADQQKRAEHSSEQAEAGEALDAPAPLDDAPAQPLAAAPARRHGGHRTPKEAKKSKDSQFMDGVYDSASGNMPSEYSAWTPDGSAPAAEQHAPASSDGSPTKRMLAILGDDSSAKPSPSVEGPHDAAHKAPSTHLRRSQASKARPLASHATPTKAAEEEDTSAAALSTASKADSDDGLSAGVKAKASVQSDADVDGDDDASELAAATPLADASTAPKTPKPHAKAVALKSTRGTVAASDASDGDADESSATSSRAKKEDADPPAEKESEQLGFDNDEAIDKAFPTPKLSVASLSAQKMQRAAGRGSLVQKAAASKPRREDIAGAVNLPTQYSAWSPTDEKAPAKKETSLEQMVADFKNDDTDDEEEVAAPPRRGQQQRRAGGSGGPGPAAAKPPQKAAASHAEEAEVVYDDDDLPRHHKRPISMDLQGGWKSFIMKGAAASKAHKAKVDPDVAIMNSLYANDGGLPKQYTAWSPSAGDADQGAPAQASDDLKAAAKELEGEASFAQLSSVTLGLSPAERLIRQAVEDAAGSGEAVRAEIAPLVFLEESATVTSNASRASVANAVLEQYSKALRSQTLSQLAHAKLSQPKLAELWQRLQKVDPLSHAGGATAPPGKRQAQAERWCQYFMQNEQSAAPVHKAVALVEKDSNALAESASQRAAMTEEANARQQLLRTVDQDVSSLSALLNATRQEQHASALSLSKEDLMALQNIDLKGATDLMAFEGAVEAFQAAHAEAADLLEATLTKRVAVLEAQRAKLSSLEKDMKAADQAVQQKQAVLTQSTKSVSAAQKQLGGIHSSCDATLSGLHRRQHTGHMEAHAVEVALKVLGSH